MADWLKIKAEWLAGKSFYALAKEHGVARSTIYTKCKTERWGETAERVQTETERKTVEKISDRLSDYEAEIAQLKHDSRILVWRVINQRLKAINEDTASADIRRMVQNYSDLLAVDPVAAADDTESSGLLEALEDCADIISDGDDSEFLGDAE